MILMSSDYKMCISGCKNVYIYQHLTLTLKWEYAAVTTSDNYGTLMNAKMSCNSISAEELWSQKTDLAISISEQSQSE